MTKPHTSLSAAATMAWCAQPTWQRRAKKSRCSKQRIRSAVLQQHVNSRRATGLRLRTFSICWIRDISKELALESHGLRMAKTGLKTIALAENGNHVSISSDAVDGADLSSEDKAAYREYRRFMSKFADIFSGLHNKIPPRITRERGDMIALGKMALNVRMLGRDDMRELLRIGRHQHLRCAEGKL